MIGECKARWEDYKEFKSESKVEMKALHTQVDANTKELEVQANSKKELARYLTFTIGLVTALLEFVRYLPEFIKFISTR
jgi:hypothetical protein